MVAPRFSISEVHFAKFLDSNDFQCRESQLQGRSVCKHTFSLVHKVMDQRSGNGEINRRILLTSQSTEGKQIPGGKMLDAKIASTMRKIIHQFQKESQCWRAACSKTWPIKERETKLLTWSMTTFKQLELLWCSSRPVRSVQYLLAWWWRSGFRYKMRPSTVGNKRNTSWECPWRFVQDEVTRFWKNFKLHWQCTTKSWVEMEYRQAIKDWGQWLDNTLVRWLGRATSKPRMEELRQE